MNRFPGVAADFPEKIQKKIFETRTSSGASRADQADGALVIMTSVIARWLALLSLALLQQAAAAQQQQRSAAAAAGQRATVHTQGKKKDQQQEVQVGDFEKVFIMVFSGSAYDKILGNKYWQGVLSNAYLLTNYYGVEHEAVQPNLVAMLGGTYQDCDSDDACYLKTDNVLDMLDEKGFSWKGYMESYKTDNGKCNYKTEDNGYYYRIHNPFFAWNSIKYDEDRCAQVVDHYQFQTDVKANDLPNLALYSPNGDNSGMNKDEDYSGKYLEVWLDNWFYKYPDAWTNTLFFVTFDRGEDDDNNHVPGFFLAGKYVQEVGQDKGYYCNHYSVTRLIEDNFGLERLAEYDAQAGSIHLPQEAGSDDDYFSIFGMGKTMSKLTLLALLFGALFLARGLHHWYVLSRPFADPAWRPPDDSTCSYSAPAEKPASFRRPQDSLSFHANVQDNPVGQVATEVLFSSASMENFTKSRSTGSLPPTMLGELQDPLLSDSSEAPSPQQVARHASFRPLKENDFVSDSSRSRMSSVGPGSRTGSDLSTL
eukprot:g8820.t1